MIKIPSYESVSSILNNCCIAL